MLQNYNLCFHLLYFDSLFTHGQDPAMSITRNKKKTIAMMTLTTVQMYSPVTLMTPLMIATSDYSILFNTAWITNNIQLHNKQFQLHVKCKIYKKNNLPITYCDQKVVVSWCKNY